jgi:diguanylate cyclase (GGDEF)-like protein
MISLKRTVGLDELLNEALKGYAGAVGAIREHGLRACPPLATEHGEALDNIRAELTSGPSCGKLEVLGRSLREQLRQFGERAFGDFQAKEDEIRELARLVAKATESLVARSSSGSKELAEFADQLEVLTAIEDLGALRRKLRAHVSEVRFYIERIAKEDADLISSLRTEVDALRHRLEAAQRSAFLDPLTHMPNRKELERQFEIWRSAQKPFSLVAFDLNRFKAINDRYSQLGGDHVLREFGHRLRAGLRYTDFACRMQDDEFAVLMDCQLRDAIVRSGQLADRISGRYALRVCGEEIRVEVSTAIGVAEHRAGETLQHVVDRAKAAIAAQKQMGV